MNNFGHIEAMKVIFFSKCSKFYVDFENRIKLRENLTALTIIDSVAGVSVSYDNNTCDQPSAC